jgi:hypothetical protein
VWSILGLHLFFPALEIFLGMSLGLFLGYRRIHPFWILLWLPTPGPVTFLLAFSVSVPISPAALASRSEFSGFGLFRRIFTATPALTTPARQGVTILRVVLFTIAIAIAAKAPIEVLLTQALPAFYVLPTLALFTSNTASVGEILLTGAISVSPAVCTREAVTKVLSVSRSDGGGFLGLSWFGAGSGCKVQLGRATHHGLVAVICKIIILAATAAFALP